MADKLLITLPCNVWELKGRLEKLDRGDVVICQYDGDGDSLYVVPVMEDLEKPKSEPKDIRECRYFLGCHCDNDKVKEFGSRRIMSGLGPFICPFHDGNDCKEYKPKTQNPVSQTNEFVQNLEAVSEASKGSQLVFK